MKCSSRCDRVKTDMNNESLKQHLVDGGVVLSINGGNTENKTAGTDKFDYL